MRTTRTAIIAAAAATGLIFGAVATLAAANQEATANPQKATTTNPSAPIPTTSTSLPPDDEPPASNTLLTWTAGGLPEGFADRVAEIPSVETLTSVAGDQTRMIRSDLEDGTVVDQPAEGWAIPLDTLAIDPSSFAQFVDPTSRSTIASLQKGDAILTESSAELRRLDIGSTIELETGSVTVAGIIDDLAGAGAELIAHRDDSERLGVATDRYILIRPTADTRIETEEAIAQLVNGPAIRFRSPTETTWLRHGDAVTPQVFVKLQFGEFAFRDQPGRDIEIDPTWVAGNIVTTEVPILGAVSCHHSMIKPLTEALTTLANNNLSHLVDTSGYAGCWSPRRISESQPVSRHAWGIATDLNIGNNPRGNFSTQDPRLIEAMTAAGFTSGAQWLVPDPGHYELIPK